MRMLRFALVAAAASLAGCSYATPTVTPADRELSAERRGLFGDLTWTRDSEGNWQRVNPDPATVEQEDFKKWRDSMTPSERQEFDDWRAWQEWKRKNPK